MCVSCVSARLGWGVWVHLGYAGKDECLEDDVHSRRVLGRVQVAPIPPHSYAAHTAHTHTPHTHANM